MARVIALATGGTIASRADQDGVDRPGRRRRPRGRPAAARRGVEDSAAADRSQLVPVAEQCHPKPALVGDRENGSGGVLVEHARFVHDEKIAGAEPGGCGRAAVDRAGDRAGLAEQHDEWIEGRRYLGLDVLARCRLRPVTGPTATSEEATR